MLLQLLFLLPLLHSTAAWLPMARPARTWKRSLRKRSQLSNAFLLKSAVSDAPSNASDRPPTEASIISGTSPPVVNFSSNPDSDRLDTKPTDFPWSNIAQFALMDNVPKYSFETLLNESNEGPRQVLTVTLWRTMSQNVIELSGYPLEFLAMQYQSSFPKQKQDSKSTDPTGVSTAPRYSCSLLPYLDEYEFTQRGGLAGRIYGLPGVAHGTFVETSALIHVARTLPNGYVFAQDEQQSIIAYELGRPRSETDPTIGATARSLTENEWTAPLYSQSGVADKLPRPSALMDDRVPASSLLDPDLVNLGSLTVALLGGAMALETLSHHLTINVFWV